MYGLYSVRKGNMIEIVVAFVCPVCKGTTICLVVGCGAMNFLKFTWREHTGILHFPMMLRICMHGVLLLNR